MERRVLTVLVVELDDLRQSELLALVEVGAARQCEHERGGRARPVQPESGIRLLGRCRADAGAGAGRVRCEAEAARVAHHVVVGEHPRARRAHARERFERLGDDVAQARREPRGREVGEVEGLVHLVRTHPLGGLRERLDPGFGAQHAVALVLGEHGVPVAVDGVHGVLTPVGDLEGAHEALGELAVLLGGLLDVGQPFGLHEAVGDVDAESVGAAVEPEAQDLPELLPHPGVRPVEVGLRAVEQVQVPVAGGAVGVGRARPRGAAEHRVPVVGGQLAVVALAGAEDEAVALGRARAGGHGLLEPLVLARAVVGHEVDDDAQAQLVGAVAQGVEVVEGAEEGVDVAVVGDVVAGVLLRRAEEGGEPDGVDAEVRERLEPLRDAGEVADAVARGVGERPRVDLVDDGGAPPLGAGSGGQLAGVPGGQGGSRGVLVGHDEHDTAIVPHVETVPSSLPGHPGCRTAGIMVLICCGAVTPYGLYGRAPIAQW